MTIVLAALGLMVVGLSYQFARSGLSAQFYYVVFWIGMLAAVIPAALRAVAWGATRRDRILAVMLVAVTTGFPKFLRNPDFPLYHDEYAHWRQASDVVANHTLFMPNVIIPIVQVFPGTSAVTAVVQNLSQLTVWHSGIAVVQFMHLAGILGMFVLVEAALGSPRAGAIGALVYAINPSAIYFSTQYAYESITINLFIWYLALGVLAVRTLSLRLRTGYLIMAYMFGALIIVTHHLTSVFLIACLGFVNAVMFLWPRVRGKLPSGSPPRESEHEPRTWLMLLSGFLIIVVAWLGLVAQATVSYLKPYFGGSVGQLTAAATTSGDKSGTSRQVLAPSVQPIWERGLTALAPVVLAAVTLTVVVIVWRERKRMNATVVGLMAFGALYFPSVLFILAPSGAEGARRSWGFSYVGLAVIIAFAILHVKPGRRRSMRWRPKLVLIGAVVLLIGNVGGGLNDPYRFPGPFLWGSDTRSASAEAAQVGRTLHDKAGSVKVITDNYTALQLAAYGRLRIAQPSDGFPVWNLVETGSDPDAKLADDITTSRYDYLVVDIRMSQVPAFNGSNIGPQDLLGSEVTPKAYIARLDSVPWASRVMSTAHLRVFRLDLSRMGEPVVEP